MSRDRSPAVPPTRTRAVTVFAAVLALLTSIATALPAGAAPAPSTSTASRKLSAPANDDAQLSSDVSEDGRYVVFVSNATNLSPKDTGAGGDVYRYDRLTGALVLVSVNAAGTAAGNGSSYTPSISDDGRYVAFASDANDLVTGFIPGNGAHESDVFRRDMTQGKTIIVSRYRTSSTNGANGDSANPDISGDGRYVAYESTAFDIVAGFVDDANHDSDVWRFDANTLTNTLVSSNNGSLNAAANDPSGNAAISSDGRYVAFTSNATNFITPFNDLNGAGTPDVFWRDVNGGVSKLVSSQPAALTSGGNGGSLYPSVSGNGRYVAFTTAATDVVTGAPADGADLDVVVRDMVDNSREIVNVPTGGPAVADTGASAYGKISADGSTVAFASSSTNLVSGFSAGAATYGVFVRKGGVTRLVSNAVGKPLKNGGADAAYPSLSGDGKVVAFYTGATDAAYDQSPAANIVVKAMDATGAVAVETGGKVRLRGQTRTFPSFAPTSTIVDVEATPSGRGLVALDQAGKVYRSGDAPSLAPFTTPTSAPVAIEMTPTGKGYWMVTANGRIAYRGDAKAFTSLTGLPDPIAAMDSTASGKGLWLVDTKGRIYERGDATAFANLSTLSTVPVVGFETTLNGGGYVMITAAGKIYRKGNMPVFDPVSPAPTGLVLGLDVTPTGKGFLAVCTDGRIIRRGDAPAYTNFTPTKPIVDIVLL